MNLHDLPTPALLLDFDIFESNLTGMAERVAASGKRLRPHAKAHKCVEIARRQILEGAAGVCVATVPEAELMVSAGIPGVLLTSPIADPAKCSRMAALSASAPDTAVIVDHEAQIRLYAEAASAAGVSLNLLVDLDVGDHRTGAATGETAVQLARAIVESRYLRFAGLQAYSVRASHIENAHERAAYCRQVLSAVAGTREMLEADGLEAGLISGGSTGSYGCDCSQPYLNEIQAGSYALMDVAYGRMEDVGFGNALTVLATVISVNQPDRVTVDAGFKAFSTDRSFGPETAAGRYEWAGDEFGYLFRDGSSRPRIGDRVRFIPPHCDPTVNLYDRIYLCRNDVVEDVWPVMDRLATKRPAGAL